jgi:hypothetical protein
MKNTTDQRLKIFEVSPWQHIQAKLRTGRYYSEVEFRYFTKQGNKWQSTGRWFSVPIRDFKGFAEFINELSTILVN